MKKGTRNIREKLNLSEEEEVDEESKITIKVGLDNLNGGVFSFTLLLINILKVLKYVDKIAFFPNFNSI